MFDWNQEEFANIIWGDEWERNNFSDPCPDQVEDLCNKGADERTSGTSKVERKMYDSKSEHGIELDAFSMHDVGEHAFAFCHDSWPSPEVPSPPNAAKLEQHSLCTDESNNLIEDETSEMDKNSAILVEGEEERNFVFHEWSNIRNFEDLDRIFSDSDTIFGDLTDTNAYDLWPTSKELSNVSLKHSLLSADSNELSDITDHNVLYSIQSSSYQNMNAAACKAPQNMQKFSHKLLNVGAAAKHKDNPDKVKRESRSKNQLVPSVTNPSLQPQQVSSVHLALPVEESIMNHYSAPAVLLTSGYEAPIIDNSYRKSEDAPPKPPSMTPKEKIEKLRRRQQMRAVLAVQKQQMQFNNEPSVSKSGFEGGKTATVQSFSILPIHDTSKMTEKNVPSTDNMVMGNFSMEESVLYRLQETVSKLDMQIRLSIRDSLFRLAKSASQRQSPNDTSSTCASSRNEACGNKENFRNQRPQMETATNPIDRTVARLLFHANLSGSRAEASVSLSSKSTNGHYLDVSESSQMTSSNGMTSSASTSFFISPGNPSKIENHGRKEMAAKTYN